MLQIASISPDPGPSHQERASVAWADGNHPAPAFLELGNAVNAGDTDDTHAISAPKRVSQERCDRIRSSAASALASIGLPHNRGLAILPGSSHGVPMADAENPDADRPAIAKD